MPATQITAEIDFAADGKHVGYLRVPHSVHRSAYGWIPVPVVSIRNGDGPTVLLLAGVHGDEYEGQIALSRLANDLAPEQIRGRVILLPMSNLPAAKAGLRTSPLDDGNLNRTFPGDPGGTPTAMIADYLEQTLFPMADYLVDLHSGGSSLFYPPTLLRGQGHTPEEAEMLQRLQAAFDLPYAWVFTGGGGPNSTARTAMGAGNRNGVVSIMAELGGGGAVTSDILAMTERGLLRILHVLGMLPDYEPDAARGTRELHAQGSVYAYQAGLFEPLKDIGDTVEKGETVGLIHHPDTPLQASDVIVSPYEGIVLCKRALARIERGDAAFQIARDAEPL
ncbi:MAG: succinylglutamate desuccinylase/aspartoacylase family protein [Antarcticimicrobium sp.]|uniref:succinylglutamate desuccinylase/aspartoacylase family protein n=1 Tax=Antarcticimicrobium sp. TaxID=2824147 RepID=UPI00261530C0|nr:succinylglutamate desuccinylase/aspartoacylase family protein [Antarcticimicrobium sp.]MDF1715965.1 succinylglutamate desuccinylase/aspartoacylase family protein [Antarcticimicrobium sp.]